MPPKIVQAEIVERRAIGHVHEFIWRCPFDPSKSCIKSSRFMSNSQLVCQIFIYPNGCPGYREYVSISINVSNSSNCRTHCLFSILNSKWEEYIPTREVSPLERTHFGHVKWIERDFLLKSNEFIHDGILSVLCRVRATPINPSSVPKRNPFDEYGDLFISGHLSDLVISVGGREIKAHKIILSARSPVFKAMFMHDMKEKATNRVEIIDIEAEVVEEMLRFIYTNRTMNIHKMADKLLIAADKYSLETLKYMCQRALCYFVCVNNAADALLLGDTYFALELKTFALNFISANYEEVVATEEWKSKVLPFPNLVSEVSQALDRLNK